MLSRILNVVRSRTVFVRALVALTAVTLAPALASATVDSSVLSAAFDVGYGYTSPGLWDKSETNTANNPPGTSPSFTVGDFNVTISVTGGLNSSAGPSFPNRVLTGSGALTGLGTNFQVVATATYTGPTPVDADTPVNYRLSLHIDEVSVYAHKHDAQAGGTNNAIQWFEIGGTNGNSSVFNVVTGTASFDQPADFTRVFWNPGEFLTAGTTQSRTFQVSRDKEFMLDGFELFGQAELVYNALPEPGATSLLAAGAALLLRRRSRGGSRQS